MTGLVITGVGRSGTGYTSKLLTTCGVPCGHEVVYGPHGPLPWPSNLVAESSWMAVPFLEDFDGFVFHQVRDPVECARSHIGIGFFSGDDRYTWFARTHAPEAFVKRDPLSRFVAFWTIWNRRAEQLAQGRTFRVENLDTDIGNKVRQLLPPDVQHFFSKKFEQALQATSKKTNTRDRDESITWNMLVKAAGKHKADFIEMTQQYGYKKR